MRSRSWWESPSHKQPKMSSCTVFFLLLVSLALNSATENDSKDEIYDELRQEMNELKAELNKTKENFNSQSNFLREEIENLRVELNKSQEVINDQQKVIDLLANITNKAMSTSKTTEPSPPSSPTTTSTATTNITKNETITLSSLEASPSINASTSTGSVIINTTSITTLTPNNTVATPTASITVGATPVEGGGDDTEEATSGNALFGMVIAILVILVVCVLLYIVYQYKYQIRDWIMKKEEEHLSNTPTPGRRNGSKYNLLPQSVHDSLHND